MKYKVYEIIKKCFTVCVTFYLSFQVRWIVEAANGRIKQWQFLAKTLPNSQIPFIGDYVRIVAALCNKYRPPLSVSSEEDQEIAAKMVYLSQRLNTLQVNIYIHQYPYHIQCENSERYVYVYIFFKLRNLSFILLMNCRMLLCFTGTCGK